MKKTIISAISTLLLFPSIAFAQTTIWKTYMYRGQEAFDGGNFSLAKDLFKAAYKETQAAPSSSEALTSTYYLALSEMSLGEIIDAEKLLIKACNLHSTDAYTSALLHYALGVNRAKQDKLNLAEKDLRRAILDMENLHRTSGQEFVSAMNALAEVLRKQGKTTEADVLHRSQSDVIRKTPFIFNDIESDQDGTKLADWDPWRNKLLWAIAAGTQFGFNEWSKEGKKRFPSGTTAWFRCVVSKNGTTAKSKMFEASGFEEFDRMVLDSIFALEGSSFVKFPANSKRDTVSQIAGCRLNSFGQLQPILPADDSSSE